MYFITTKRMLEVCFFQHTPTFIIEPKKTAGLSIRQYLLWKIAHSALTAAFMAVLTGILGFHFF